MPPARPKREPSAAKSKAKGVSDGAQLDGTAVKDGQPASAASQTPVPKQGTTNKTPTPPVPPSWEGTGESDKESHQSGDSKELEPAEVHNKRKAFIGQVSTHNKGDGNDLIEFKAKKLKEYQEASKVGKNLILKDWLKHDQRLKSWYSNVSKTREEVQEWTDSELSGWMKPAKIAELNKLDFKNDDGDKQRLDFLLATLEARNDPVFFEQFGDKQYYYEHRDEVFEFRNKIQSKVEARSTSDVKGKLYDPQLEDGGNKASAMASLSLPSKIKIENPCLDKLKKLVTASKKMESKGLQELPALVLLARTANQDGKGLLVEGEKNFMIEVSNFAEAYEKGDEVSKGDNQDDIEAHHGSLSLCMQNFSAKVSAFKLLKTEVKTHHSV